MVSAVVSITPVHQICVPENGVAKRKRDITYALRFIKMFSSSLFDGPARSELAIGKRSLLLCILLLLNILASQRNPEALFQLPDNARIEWSFEYTTTEDVDFYQVEEFIDRRAGSVHIKLSNSYVENLSNSVSYYRINQPSDLARELKDDKIVMYSQSDLFCRASHLSTWPLKDLSQSLEALGRFEGLATKFLDERTAIGGSTLLRLVAENADKLKFEKKSYDTASMSDVLLFKADFSTKEVSFRLVCVMPQSSAKNFEAIPDGTTLASLASPLYPKSIAIITFEPGESIAKLGTRQLLVKYKGFSTRLIVDYDFIGQRSSVKNLGIKFSSDDVENPFLLPSGVGCGSAYDSNFLIMKADKFSGLFRSGDSNVQRYVAYDAASNHLRIDLLGRHRLIFDLQCYAVTYISEDLYNGDDELGASSAHNNLCISSYLDNADLSEIRSMQNVLGLGGDVSVVYLGNKRLDDGTNCRVYERELSAENIPYLLKMNMKTEPTNGRFFLVAYLVQELNPGATSSGASEIEYQSTWLKRLELTSIEANSNHLIMHSTITFSQSAWNLEIMSEETGLNDALHPVRVFDTLVCKSNLDQYRLELVAKEDKHDEALFAYFDEYLESNHDIIEEAMMNLITSRTSIPRSKVNQLALAQVDSGEKLDGQSLLVTAKISLPSDLNYRKTLIGYVVDLEQEILNPKSNELASVRMTRQEFILSSAFELTESSSQPLSIYFVVYCGEKNFARSLLNIDQLKYLYLADGRQSQRTKCELYSVKLLDNQAAPVSEKYSPRTIKANLMGSPLSVSFFLRNYPYQATVVEVEATKGLSEHALGILVEKGQCYTGESYRVLEEPIEVTQVTLDIHQSLVTCHRACGLHMNCRSYSYNTLDRTCALTNIPSDSIYLISGNKLDANCAIYEPNSLFYYRPESAVYLINLPSLNFNHYLLKATLNQCAILCRSNEMRQAESGNSKKTIHCDSFKYMHRAGICAIYDRHSLIYKAEVGGNWQGLPVDYYMKLFGKSVWTDEHPAYTYQRDYRQYFDVREHMELKSDDKTLSSVDGSMKVLSLTKLLDRSEKQCLLECAMLNDNCVMVDRCRESFRTSCTMYMIADTRLLSKYGADSVSVPLYDALTNLETSNDQLVLFLERLKGSAYAESKYCDHFGLKNDYLTSKRAFLKKSPSEEQMIKDLIDEDLAESNNSTSFVDHLDKTGKHLIKHSPAIILSSFTFLIGIVFGASLFIYKPLLEERYPISGLTQFASHTWRDGMDRLRFYQKNEPMRVRLSPELELREIEDM